MRWSRGMLALGLVVAAVVVTAPRAGAACHIARFIETELTGAEGDRVLVAIERDGNVCGGESTVRYETVAGSAVPGEDYEHTEGIATFNLADDNLETFEVPIVDDAVAEGEETFTIRLSDGTGAITTTGEDAVVTITADGDTSPPTEPVTTEPPAPTSTSSTPSSTSTAPPTTSVPSTTAPSTTEDLATTSSTETTTSVDEPASTATTGTTGVDEPVATSTTALAAPDDPGDDDGGDGVVVLALVVVLLVAAGGVVYLVRSRGV